MQQLPNFAECAIEWWRASGERSEKRLRDLFDHFASTDAYYSSKDGAESREYVWIQAKDKAGLYIDAAVLLRR